MSLLTWVCTCMHTAWEMLSGFSHILLWLLHASEWAQPSEPLRVYCDLRGIFLSLFLSIKLLAALPFCLYHGATSLLYKWGLDGKQKLWSSELHLPRIEVLQDRAERHEKHRQPCPPQVKLTIDWKLWGRASCYLPGQSYQEWSFCHAELGVKGESASQFR